jgi:hypothetical protein
MKTSEKTLEESDVSEKVLHEDRFYLENGHLREQKVEYVQVAGFFEEEKVAEDSHQQEVEDDGVLERGVGSDDSHDQHRTKAHETLHEVVAEDGNEDGGQASEATGTCPSTPARC